MFSKSSQKILTLSRVYQSTKPKPKEPPAPPSIEIVRSSPPPAEAPSLASFSQDGPPAPNTAVNQPPSATNQSSQFSEFHFFNGNVVIVLVDYFLYKNKIGNILAG